MVLFVIGLGLGDERDITVKGLDAVRQSSRVYLEAYTSLLVVDKSVLERFYGKPVTVADRELVESNADEILRNADTEDVSFLVVGDPFGATTHHDLLLRAKQQGVPVTVVHNASIMNAVGCCGLQLYAFGQTISIPFFTAKWRPTSFYVKMAQNKALGMHTLCLLDIKVKEQSEENLARGRRVFEPPRFMTVNTAAEQLLEAEREYQQGAATPQTLAVGLARVGTATQQICYGTLEQLRTHDFGAPLHSMVLIGETHILEQEFLEQFRLPPPPPPSDAGVS
jgi:diphthine methyl ester synthase